MSLVRYDPRYTVENTLYNSQLLPYEQPRCRCYECEQNRVQNALVRDTSYRTRIQTTTVSRTCTTCGARFHRGHSETRTTCTRCHHERRQTSIRYSVDPVREHGHHESRHHREVAGFSQSAVTSVARSVFTQPRSANVTAREVKFDNGTFIVREEYRRV